MGKISKYSNLYDRNGKLIRSVDSVSGRLEPYSIEELEKLVDTLDKNSKEFANATAILMHMYEQKGNPHRDELIQKLIEQSKTKTTKAEVINALNDIKDEETGKDGSSTEGRVPDTSERAGELGGGSNSNETDTTISTAA